MTKQTRWLAQDRPIVFFDLETTGSNRAKDRIVEVGIVRLEVNGAEKIFHSLVNPGIPIPSEVTKIHGITDEKVAASPKFEEIAADIVALLDGADLGGFNIARFDVELLAAELRRAGVTLELTDRRIFDALTIYHAREPRDLSAAHRFYCNIPLENAHSALDDALASLRVFRGQFAKYADLTTDPKELHALCNRRRRGDAIDREGKLIMKDGEPTLNFGQKHSGTSLREIARKDPSYLKWIVNKGDFSTEVKSIVEGVLAETAETEPTEA